MSRMLVAGCGYVGTALAERLARAGHTVWALRRQANLLPSGINAIGADLTQVDNLKQLPTDLDVVFYTAAADDRSESAYRAAYVDGLRNLTRSAKGQSLHPRVIFSSSTAVYAQDDGRWLDEESETAPTRHSGKLLLEGEAVLSASGLPYTILRFGGIYGPGRESLLRSVREGRATFENTPQYTNRIHRDDCVGALVHLAQLASPARIYIGVDDEPAERRVVLDYLASLTSAPPPQLSATSPSQRGGNKRCRNARLKSSGYRFTYPSFREGYAAMLRDPSA